MKISRKITRRQFLEQSVATSLAGGRASGLAPRKADGAPRADSNSRLALKVTGDARQGFSVSILFNGRPLAHHNRGGEFSAKFQNEDRSLEDLVEDWRATSWRGDAAHVILTGECKLRNLSRDKQSPPVSATVRAEVDYAVVTPYVVRKQIRLRQADLYMLFYQISNRLEPEAPPAGFWSFDQSACRGGALHEHFPAAGFRTRDGLTVGLLTDAGFRNQWTRLIRRDGEPVKPAPQRIPDPNLYFVCDSQNRAKGELFVQQTFGEALVWTPNKDGSETVRLPPPAFWTRRGQVTLGERDGLMELFIKGSESRVLIPFTTRSSEVYSIRLEYRSPQPFALAVWDVDGQFHQLENITLYNDRLPASPAGWSAFHTFVFFYSTREGHGALCVSPPGSEQAINSKTSANGIKIELRGLEVRRLHCRREPYHRLEMDKPIEKTAFIFVDDRVPDTLRGNRLASQLRLAEALGFRGSEIEKVLFADAMMLCWAASPETPRPMLAPSIWYSAAGEMYLRDSFFALNGIHNRELNLGVFNLWAENQGPNGAINTLIEPNMANLERKSNDSTPLWLVWALQNRRRFGAKLPMDKIRKAAEYCLATYDRRHDGICWAQFVIGQLDIVDFPQGTSDLCENQGMLAVTLRVIKELAIPGISVNISEGYIARAEEAYRSYYDPARKMVRPARDITDAIGFGEIFPEFLSLWLFDRKILTDEMVQNHLNQIPLLMPRPDAPYPEEGGTVRPVFIGLSPGGKGWSYFTETWHPMISNEHAVNYADHNMDGIYYNGGSWMRLEVCGYVAGKLHGWKRAERAIGNRMWAEINLSPDFPTSQEYLATDPAHRFFGHHRVFAWNSFVLLALELAGLRTPEMTPHD
jgi:hypothetical protein